MALTRAYIEITNHCGLNCEFCEPKKNTKTQMDIDLFEKIHKELHIHKTKELSYHILGDPLTVANIHDYLDISAAYQIPVNLTTSGFYIGDVNQKTLFHPAIKQINFSLSSFHANKNQTLPLDDYLERLCVFAKQSYKLPKRFVNFRLWNEGDANYADFNTLITNYLSKSFDVAIRQDERKTKLASYTLLVKDNMFTWPSVDKQPMYKNGTCHAIHGQIGFLANGTVVPCCLDTHADMALGSIKDTSLAEILNGQKAKKMLAGFKNNILVETMCQTCGFRDTRL